MMSVGMSLSGYEVGGGVAESGQETMADEEEEGKQILQKLQVGCRIKPECAFVIREKQGGQFMQCLRIPRPLLDAACVVWLL